MRHILFKSLFILASVLMLGQSAQADTYPDRPIKWIVPWPPGGGADVIARLLGNPVAEALGKPVIIDNRGGAAGNIGAVAAARSPADGYTMVFAYSGTHSINRHLYKDMPFEEKDFSPVIFLTSVPQMLVVNANLPFKSVQEIITAAKANPGKLTYGSSGNGAINHLTGQLFSDMAGVKLLHVPYKGGGPAAAAVMGGEVDMVFGEPSTLLPHVASGKLRAIATTGAKRSISLPDLPTIAESGVPGYDVTSWNGVLVPVGTPAEAIKKLNAEFNKVLANPAMRERLVKIGYEPIGGAPDAFSKHIEAETKKWGPVIKQSGLQIN
ncbi:MAG: tripartite tricarboxylate transporter substrate binding protein [Sheuella sp.]|nr:tripartite tricarboxylate transporter substrate binding protein [Sheuella sp.]